MSDYRLDDLGWRGFETLVQTLLKREISLAVEAWGGTGDHGNDAYCRDALPFPGPELSPGPFTFQVKFVENANAAGAKPRAALDTAVRSECKRIGGRRAAGEADPAQYVLITNAPMSADLRRTLRDLIAEELPAARITLWDGNDVGRALDASPAVRQAFPQILGLRDLQSLLRDTIDRNILVRSTLAVERAVEIAATFVSTGACGETWSTLRNHGFAVLTGAPEAGKTAIARVIGLTLLADAWQCYECLGPDDILQRFDCDEPQLFIADDAFGSTEFRFDAADAWSSRLDGILRIVDERHWILWTARSAILHETLSRIRLQGRAAAFPEPARVTIDAGRLTTEERAQILYAHCKQARLDEEVKKEIRESAEELVNHPYFTPERARLLASQVATMPAAEVTGRRLMSFIREPTRVMQQSFEVLPFDRKVFLLAVIDSDAQTGSIAKTYERLRGDAAGKPADYLLRELSEHFLRVVSRKNPAAEWVHPSWRDIVIGELVADTALRRLFLSRCERRGIALALSTAGGSEGERVAPLLRDDEDGALIASALRSDVGSTDDPDRVIELVTGAVKALKAGGDGRLGSCKQIARAVLDAIRQRMAAKSNLLVKLDVRKYYALAREIDLVAQLPVDPLWSGTIATVEKIAAQALREREVCVEHARRREQEHRHRVADLDAFRGRMKRATTEEEILALGEEARRRLEELDEVYSAARDAQPEVTIECRSLERWVDLIEILREHDPGALQRLHYPEDYPLHLVAVADALKAVLEYGTWHRMMRVDSEMASGEPRTVRAIAERFAKTLAGSDSTFKPLLKASRSYAPDRPFGAYPASTLGPSSGSYSEERGKETTIARIFADL